ncbi:Dirigent protein 24 [Linum perenne]
MAKHNVSSFCLFLLLIAFALSISNAARILDELEPTATSSATILTPTTASPSSQIVSSVAAPVDDDGEEESADPPLLEAVIPPTAVPVPASGEAPPLVEEDSPVPSPIAVPAPAPTVVTPAPTATSAATAAATPAPAAAAAATSATTAAAGAPALSFYMHDILGGSHPSARVVAGIIARTGINGIPFSVPNNNIFPLQGGTPLVNPTNLNNLINPNTAPLITGLNPNTGSARTNTVLQNAGSSGGGVNPNSNNQPFVTAGQLPAGLTLQKLIFGSITVFDDELTEGHELGSAVLGRAQGFYLASSVDGTSHTMSMTLMMHGHEHENEHEDTISFFGVHRNAAPVSSVAVVGGTGKYEDAKGYATIEAIQQEDQHVTDGVDTITHINVYLSI